LRRSRVHPRPKARADPNEEYASIVRFVTKKLHQDLC
jgi:hypothetical protein